MTSTNYRECWRDRAYESPACITCRDCERRAGRG